MLKQYIPSPIVAGWVVQDMNVLVGVGYPPPGGHMQFSSSGRVVTLVAVSQGNVYTANAGDTSWSTPTNGTSPLATPPLNYSGIVFSTPLNQKLWFADGVNWVYYDPSVNTVFTWAATQGTLPADSAGNTPRLICTWRGRMVLSGLLLDPQNWFMSAVTDPTNWQYFPTSITPTQAVAGNNSPLGLIGDVVTGLIPYSDDTLIVLGDSTIYQMSGDPMSGGQIDRITDEIGGAWGAAWTKDPYGAIYFVSNKTGIYKMTPGQGEPQRISQQIEQLLQTYDTGNTTIRLLWSDKYQGLHVFLTPTSAPAVSQHLFWEWRSGAWWQDQLGNPNQDPLCCCVFDGNLPGDRVALIGSWDGYVRYFDTGATTDDGWPVASSVLIGPLTTKNLDDLLLKDLQAVLGETSGAVSYAVYVGSSAEKAINTTPVATGTWGAGRNLNTQVRRSGHGIYVQLSSTVPWAMEVIRARLSGLGKVRRRGA
jgi:hypothetical protein